METLAVIVSGTAVAAFISSIGTIVMFILQRQATKKDKCESKLVQTEAERMAEHTVLNQCVQALEFGLRVVLHDRLKHLGRGYIGKHGITIDEREDFLKMHSAHHSLGGNGNLDGLLKQIMELPLKGE